MMKSLKLLTAQSRHKQQCQLLLLSKSQASKCFSMSTDPSTNEPDIRVFSRITDGQMRNLYLIRVNNHAARDIALPF